MKIYFSVYGVGSGHSIRSFRLADTLYRDGHEIYLSTFGDGIRIFKDKDKRSIFKKILVSKSIEYKWIEEGLSWSGTLAYSAINYNTLYSHLIDEYRNLKSIMPDIVISDSRISTLLASYKLNIKSIVITNQLSIKLPKDIPLISRLFTKIWNLADSIIIPDLPPKYTITYSNIVPYLGFYNKRKLFFAGLIYEKPDLIRSCEVDKDIDLFFMISAPTHDRLNFVKAIYRRLNILSRESRLLREYNIVILEGAAYKKNFRKVLNDNIRVFGWLDNPHDILKRSKIVILRGGQTSILESIMAMTPMIVIPACRQTEQIENARRVEELGLGYYMDYKMFLRDPTILINSINSILNKYSYFQENIRKVRNVLIKVSNLNRLKRYIMRMAI